MSATDTPNWVAERAKCDMRELTSQVIQLVTQATEEMNALRGHGYTIKSDEAACRVSRVSFGHVERACIFAYEEEGRRRLIRVSKGTPKTPESDIETCTIETRWDTKKIKCRLVVTPAEGEKVEFPHKHLWKVVQYILEPFFFPE